MKTKQDDSILFLGKQSDMYCDQALKLCERSFSRVTSCIGNPYGEPLPEKALEWEGDYIISYLGRIPTAGEHLFMNLGQIVIKKASDRYIEKVLIYPKKIK